jgi:hypothetical protein
MRQYFSGLRSKREALLLQQAGADSVLVDQFDLPNAIGFKSVALDSGAYRAMKSCMALSVDRYLAFLRSIDLNAFDFALSLDVIGEPYESYRNWLSIYPEFPVVPVWHYGTDRRHLDPYLAMDCKLIAIGGLALPMREQLTQKTALHAVEAVLDDHPHTDFHLCGLNWLHAIQILKAYPNAYSFDTSKFLDGARYRQIIYVEESTNGPVLMQRDARRHLKKEVGREECVTLCIKGLLEFMAL